ncbi:MAG: hypothetical protein A4E35_01240 [Methanoregula sp. PtaU1.Bin051]|nr:MAG: hypothetical protein A4E35_01240 [Methanoregula sp. PtaU1.Bin051]
MSPAARATERDIEGFLTRTKDPTIREHVLRRYLRILAGAPEPGYQYLVDRIEHELARLDPSPAASANS